MAKCAMGIQNACFAYPQGNACRAGDTTTLHSLMTAPAFKRRLSTTELSHCQGCYLMTLPKKSRGLAPRL